MTNRPIHSLVGPFLLTTVLVAGCGQSREEEVLAKAASRPKPGFVRLINLTDGSCKLLDGQRPITSDAAANATSSVSPTGTKTNDVVIQKASGSSMHVAITIKSGEVDSVVLYPDGKTTAVIADGLRLAGLSENATVAYLDSSGRPTSPVKVQLKDPSGLQSIALDKARIQIPEGTYEVSGAGIEQKVELKVEPKFAYSLIFIEESPGKYRAFALVNSDTTKPGTSAAGST